MMNRDFSYINEEFFTLKVSPSEMDTFLANGWRHFGAQFFRYNLGFHENQIRLVLPLRIRLANFSLSTSQRRVLKKNQDLQLVFRPSEVTAEKTAMFEKHKHRFKTGVPDSIYDFISRQPDKIPGEGKELCLYNDGRLLAVTFFDVGQTSISAVYAMFETDDSWRSLGIFMMLAVIEYAIENQKIFYYPGYAYEGNSFYDYKKRFRALELYDWRGNWEDYKGDF